MVICVVLLPTYAMLLLPMNGYVVLLVFSHSNFNIRKRQHSRTGNTVVDGGGSGFSLSMTSQYDANGKVATAP